MPLKPKLIVIKERIIARLSNRQNRVIGQTTEDMLQDIQVKPLLVKIARKVEKITIAATATTVEEKITFQEIVSSALQIIRETSRGCAEGTKRSPYV